MRVVGSLLVSALMVIPVAIAQLSARSFRSTMGIAMVLGVLICTCGLSLTYFIDLSPGATIVVGAIGLYAIGFRSGRSSTAFAGCVGCAWLARTTSTPSRRSPTKFATT